MHGLDDLTVLVLAFDEEANIGRSLDSVAWARNILLIDSNSADATCAIAEQHAQLKVLRRAFDNHAAQWNFGLEHVETPWVLTIDADYVFPPGAETAISEAIKADTGGYDAAFRYLVHGRHVRGSLLPARTVLFRRDAAYYVNDGHTQRLQGDFAVKLLPFVIAHDDRKPLRRWLRAQVRYAELEAEKLTAAPRSSLGLNDRVRKYLFVAPLGIFFLVYFLRGGMFSGWRGLFYALQRFTAELLLSLFLVERLIKRKD